MDNTSIYLLFILFRSYLFFSFCQKLHIYLPTRIHVSSFLFQMVCSDRATFSCDNLCGNPLACGNHYCTNVCHTLVTSTSKLDSSSRAETCEKCTLPCQQVWINILSISSVRLTKFFFGAKFNDQYFPWHIYWLYQFDVAFFMSWNFIVSSSGIDCILLLILI